MFAGEKKILKSNVFTGNSALENELNHVTGLLIEHSVPWLPIPYINDHRSEFMYLSAYRKPKAGDFRLTGNTPAPARAGAHKNLEQGTWDILQLVYKNEASKGEALQLTYIPYL